MDKNVDNDDVESAFKVFYKVTNALNTFVRHHGCTQCVLVRNTEKQKHYLQENCRAASTCMLQLAAFFFTVCVGDLLHFLAYSQTHLLNGRLAWNLSIVFCPPQPASLLNDSLQGQRNIHIQYVSGSQSVWLLKIIWTLRRKGLWVLTSRLTKYKEATIIMEHSGKSSVSQVRWTNVLSGLCVCDTSSFISR